MLVGAVVAAAADEPYIDFVQREILAPLGMGSTVADLAGRTEPGSAHFYYPRFMLDPRYGLHDAPAGASWSVTSRQSREVIDPRLDGLVQQPPAARTDWRNHAVEFEQTFGDGLGYGILPFETSMADRSEDDRQHHASSRVARWTSRAGRSRQTERPDRVRLPPPQLY